MTSNSVIWILILNTAAAVVYTAVVWLRNRQAYAFFRGTMILLCPVVGGVCVAFGALMNHVLKHREVDYANLSIDKTRKKFLEQVDAQREMETLPLEEVLTVAAAKNRRRAMLNMLRLDVRENLSLVHRATENDDPETVHYAATALTDTLGKFMGELNSLQIEYDKDRSNLEANQAFLDAVVRIINSGGLTGVEETKYDWIYIRLILNLERYHPEEITDTHYAMMVRALYKVGSTQEAEQWAQRSLERYPESEESHLNVLFIKYMLNKGEEFDAALNRLTSSNTSLSEKGLQIVRFWLGRQTE